VISCYFGFFVGRTNIGAFGLIILESVIYPVNSVSPACCDCLSVHCSACLFRLFYVCIFFSSVLLLVFHLPLTTLLSVELCPICSVSVSDVVSGYILLVIMKSLYHVTDSVPMDVMRHLLLMARLSGTLPKDMRDLEVSEDSYSLWRRLHLRSTSVFSALEVFFTRMLIYVWHFSLFHLCHACVLSVLSCAVQGDHRCLVNCIHFGPLNYCAQSVSSVLKWGPNWLQSQDSVMSPVSVLCHFSLNQSLVHFVLNNKHPVYPGKSTAWMHGLEECWVAAMKKEHYIQTHDIKLPIYSQYSSVDEIVCCPITQPEINF